MCSFDDAGEYYADLDFYEKEHPEEAEKEQIHKLFYEKEYFD